MALKRLGLFLLLFLGGLCGASDAGSRTLEPGNPPQNAVKSRVLFNVGDTGYVDDDFYEPDDFRRWASRIVDDKPQHHSISYWGDWDWVYFELDTPSEVEIETSGELFGDTVLHLYSDDSGEEIDFDDDGGFMDYSEIEREGEDDLPPGRYFVLVEEYTGKNLIGDYWLELRTHALPFRLSGTVRTGGIPLAGVTVTAGEETVITRLDGVYRLRDLEPGWYDVRPSLPGYRFTPESRRVRVGPDATDVDFEAQRLFRVNGRITAGGKPLAGARVSAGNASVFTGSSGLYQLPGLTAGSYSLTVQKDGYAFEPAERTVTVGPDQSGVDFVGRLNTALAGFTLSPSPVTGGATVTGTVTFLQPLPVAAVLEVASSDPRTAKPVQKLVRLPARVTTASFRIRTRRVSAPVPVTIRVSLGGSVVEGSLLVQP